MELVTKQRSKGISHHFMNALINSNQKEGANGSLTGQACLSLHRPSQRTVCLSLHRPSQCINDLASEAPHSQVISKERETNKSKLATQEEPRLVQTTNYKHDKF